MPLGKSVSYRASGSLLKADNMGKCEVCEGSNEGSITPGTLDTSWPWISLRIPTDTASVFLKAREYGTFYAFLSISHLCAVAECRGVVLIQLKTDFSNKINKSNKQDFASDTLRPCYFRPRTPLDLGSVGSPRPQVQRQFR